jgi:hypothetical protein
MKFWDWLMSIFEDDTSKMEMEQPSGRVIDTPKPADGDILVANGNTFVPTDLDALFTNAAVAAVTKKNQLEEEMLADPILKKYVTNTITYIAQELMGSNNFVMIGALNVGCPQKSFPTFCNIFIKMCEKSGMSARMSSGYLYIPSNAGNIFKKKMRDITQKIESVGVTDLSSFLRQ